MTSKDNSVFQAVPLKRGLLHDFTASGLPLRLYGWDTDSSSFQGNSTFYGYIQSGPAMIKTVYNNIAAQTDQYFCTPRQLTVSGGKGIVIEAIGSKALNDFGGPVEAKGALRYIDGCTDTLLISPIRLGEPCLNALFFPPSIAQTKHTHPSVRIGVVIRGQGECKIPSQSIPLIPGTVFIIHQNGPHSFHTDKEQGMTVIAFHPDSDYGPQDDHHPMINRTMVEGRSAATLPHLQTK